MKLLFTNKLGNRIKLSVKATTEEVELKLRGPTSQTEWILTRDEAERLHGILGLVLKL
jgi:hypothetical protein